MAALYRGTLFTYVKMEQLHTAEAHIAKVALFGLRTTQINAKSKRSGF